MLSKDIWYILLNFHFMFLIDIDLISKKFKILLDGSSGFCRHPPFRELSTMDFLNFEIYKNMFKMCVGVS